jgi:CRISPR-associated exonuclease Cas4
MSMGPILPGIASVLGLLGVILAVLASWARIACGLGHGETVTLDDVTLHSESLGLVGRPDRVVKRGDSLIPEEWKSSRRVEPWHVVQLATYFLLIEERYGVRPAHGFIVLGDGTRKRIANTKEIRDRVIEIASEIREARRRIEGTIPVSPPRWQCRVCGVRSRCRQSRA